MNFNVIVFSTLFTKKQQAKLINQ